MSRPIAPAKGIAFAFPDVCKTPTPGGPVPMPYPNIAQLNQANPVTDEGGKELLVGPSSDHVLLAEAEVTTSTGGEAGSVGAVNGTVPGSVVGPCKITQASGSVIYGAQGKGLVRFMDATDQNNGNATGMVLSAFPTVLVGD
jgi:hypothetical protein